MPLCATKVMASLPGVTIPLVMEAVIIDGPENYRPVQQGTARNETTKDKAGALSPTACIKTIKFSGPQY